MLRVLFLIRNVIKQRELVEIKRSLAEMVHSEVKTCHSLKIFFNNIYVV